MQTASPVENHEAPSNRQQRSQHTRSIRSVSHSRGLSLRRVRSGSLEDPVDKYRGCCCVGPLQTLPRAPRLRRRRQRAAPARVKRWWSATSTTRRSSSRPRLRRRKCHVASGKTAASRGRRQCCWCRSPAWAKHSPHSPQAAAVAFPWARFSTRGPWTWAAMRWLAQCCIGPRRAAPDSLRSIPDCKASRAANEDSAILTYNKAVLMGASPSTNDFLKTK